MLNPEAVDEKTAEPFIDTIDKEDKESIECLRDKAKTKPYHAIMRIALYIWPLPQRKKVTQLLAQLRELRGDLHADKRLAILDGHHHTKLVWENLNVKDYYEYVNRHKHYVTTSYISFNDLITNSVKLRLFSEGYLLPEHLPEENPSKQQIEDHDNSKYSFVETVTYAMKWYPCKGMGKCDDEAYDTGLQHHYCNNEHHPEFWGNQPMHWRFIVEAVYDMAAMELERRFQGQIPDNRAELLLFKPQYLSRFETTGQLDFIKKLIDYTIEAYCGRYALPKPEVEEHISPSS